jgi:hypothetical protein
MTDATTTTATTTTGDTTTATTAPWHQGLGADIVGKAQQKGWDITDPQKAFAAATQAYMGAEKLVGHPPERMARIPEVSAQPAELDAFWQRLGMPKEAKEYDLSAVKFDGEALDEAFVDVLRAAFHSNRVPKEAAAPIAQAVAKFMEDADKTEATTLQTRVTEQIEALKKSWGHNYDVNMTVAKLGFTRLAAAAGLDEKTAKEAVDAISQLSGLGAANVMKIFQVAGSRMGEGSFITMPKPGGGELPMTREAAASEIETLKQDTGFRQKLLAGDVASRQRWDSLHQIATGANSRAA